jgi:FtsZ-binding cell division protein ZapB
VQELARRNAALTSEVEELKAALGRTDSDKATLQQQLQQVLGRLEAVETQLGLKASTAK